jgi:hypothetical protein
MKDVLFISAPNPTVPVRPDDNDIIFSGGDVVMVSGKERKFQDIAKILLTRIGSDPIFPSYGSEIPNVVGQPAVLVDDKLTDGVLQAMAFLAEVETSREPNENIASIRSLKIETPPEEPRQRTVRLDVALTDGSVVQTNVRI